MTRRWSQAARTGSGAERIIESAFGSSVDCTVTSSVSGSMSWIVGGRRSSSAVTVKMKSVEPQRIWSPAASSTRSTIACPFTNVPFAESRSRRNQVPSSGVSSACRRLTVVSVMGSDSLLRPMSCGSWDGSSKRLPRSAPWTTWRTSTTGL
jgi:hypothetical protein